jgi:type III pantothenate kinase
MLLAVDIGNTNITLGLFRPGQRSVGVSWRLSTRSRSTADEYGIKIMDFFHYAGCDAAEVNGIAVASVVPPLDPVFREMTAKYFRCRTFFIEPGINLGLRVLYDNPAEVGADRVVNAAAAFERVKGSCIVVDFGTATTFDCVTRRGDYMGGVIAPGPGMAAEALAQRTAKLPLLGAFEKPRRVVGKNTVESMNAGLFYGYLGLTREILLRLKKEMGGKPRVLATGGLASLLAPHLKEIQQVLPDLTLEGLRLLWERNQ